MVTFDKIPSYIFEILANKGIDKNQIYLMTYCDMDCEHNYCDTYVIATKESLYVISGTEALSSKEGIGKGLNMHWNENSFREYKMEELKSIRVEELLSTSRLTARDEQEDYIFLSAMTNFCKGNAGLFVKYFMIV